MSVQLGLGLIGIGRPWGHIAGDVPPEGEVLALLESALDLGVRYFDTAPSYGWSERRLGKFLHSLAPDVQADITVATKFGEHWDFKRGAPFVDHGYDALRRSLDRSVELLGKIDVLQLHKTTTEVLASEGLARAWEYARSLGIARLGASVSDEASARAALADPALNVLQVPLNRANTRFAGVVEEAGARGAWVAVNRPFAMGAMLYDATTEDKVEAFRFILDRRFEGVVLTGTRSPAHLMENWRAFREADSPAA